MKILDIRRRTLSKWVETWKWHPDDLIESAKKVDMMNESGPVGTNYTVQCMGISMCCPHRISPRMRQKYSSSTRSFTALWDRHVKL